MGAQLVGAGVTSRITGLKFGCSSCSPCTPASPLSLLRSPPLLPGVPLSDSQSPDPRVWTWERELSNRIRQVPRFFPKAHGCPLSGASRMGSGRARSVPGGAVSDPDSHSRGRGARRAQPLRTVLSRLQLSPRLPPGARSPGSRPGSGDPNAGLERSQFWVRGGVCLRQRPREKQSVR